MQSEAAQHVKKPHRVCASRRKKFKTFFTATCAWEKIPLRLQVWNFYTISVKIVRAADCDLFGRKIEDFSPVTASPGREVGGVFLQDVAVVDLHHSKIIPGYLLY